MTQITIDRPTLEQLLEDVLQINTAAPAPVAQPAQGELEK